MRKGGKPSRSEDAPRVGSDKPQPPPSARIARDGRSPTGTGAGAKKHPFRGNQYTGGKSGGGWSGDKKSSPGGSHLAKGLSLAARIDALEAALIAVAGTELGDSPGHPFHGNQYTYEVQYAEDHEKMAKGEYKTTQVRVMAKDEPTANLHAAQMAVAVAPSKGKNGGIPTSTKLISTRLGAKLPDHGQTGSVKAGDVIVDASRVGRSEDDFSYLHGATVKSAEQGYGGGITRYTDRNGYEGKAILKGGVVTVERPASGTSSYAKDTVATDTGGRISKADAAEKMYGTGSAQHLEAIKRFG